MLGPAGNFCGSIIEDQCSRTHSWVPRVLGWLVTELASFPSPGHLLSIKSSWVINRDYLHPRWWILREQVGAAAWTQGYSYEGEPSERRGNNTRQMGQACSPFLLPDSKILNSNIVFPKDGEICVSQRIWIFNLFFAFGSHQVCLGLIPRSVLRDHIWRCSGDHMGCQGSNSVSCVLRARQIPHQLVLSLWLLDLTASA